MAARDSSSAAQERADGQRRAVAVLAVDDHVLVHQQVVSRVSALENSVTISTSQRVRAKEAGGNQSGVFIDRTGCAPADGADACCG